MQTEQLKQKIASGELDETLLDIYVKGLLVTHGYHKGTVLKDYIRNSFEHKNILKKINIDASRTLLLVDMGK